MVAAGRGRGRNGGKSRRIAFVQRMASLRKSPASMDIHPPKKEKKNPSTHPRTKGVGEMDDLGMEVEEEEEAGEQE